MARAPDARIDQALELYRKGLKLVEIASQLNLPEGTVRRWKSTHKWDSERSDNKASVRNDKANSFKSSENPIAEEVESVMNNPDLTDKQRVFCLNYVRCFNATKAYQKAYAVDYQTANSHGFELLLNVVIKDEIMRLKQNRLNRELLSESDIFQKYMDIAFADITDFVEFGNAEIEAYDKNGEPIDRTINYVNIRDHTEVDGTLINEVSKGKDGVKVKLADRMGALKWLADHMDLATDLQRAQTAALMVKAGGGDMDEDQINDNIVAIAELLNNPVPNRRGVTDD